MAFRNEASLAFWIKHRSGFVKNQNCRIFQQCARKRDSLLDAAIEALDLRLLD